MAQTAFQRDRGQLWNGIAGLPGSLTRPFMPGQRMDVYGGMWDPQVQGSLGNSAWGLTSRIFGGDGNGAAEAQKFADYAFKPLTGATPDTPPGAPKVFGKPGNSYKDPAWGGLESQAADIAAQKLGNPNLAAQLRPMLAAIRTSGEKSNNDQVSPKGARTVYQIMPATAKLFQQKYGVDASTPEGSATVAALHLGESLQRGGDPVREYIGGPDKSKWGNQTAAYGNRVWNSLGNFQQAADAVGLNQPMPQFDASGYRAANNILGQVAQNQMTPFSATYNEQALPPPPAPDPLQTPDYTKSDEAFAKAAPKNPFGTTPEEQERGKLRMRRMDYFAGMAKMLGSIDWSRGVGLGELFAKLGAGALMGAKAGDSEVQDKMEAFDNAMQRYNLALANREDGKAKEQINIANQNIAAMNQHKNNLWQVQIADIQKHQPRVQDGVLTTFTKNQDGTTTETHTPLDPARQTAAMLAQGNNAIAAANAHNEYNWQTYRANRELAGAALPYAMADASAQGNAQGRDGAFLVGVSEASIAAVESGQWEQLYSRYMPNGSQVAADTRAEAMRVAGVQPGQNPTAEQSDQMKQYLTTQLMTDFVNSGKTWALIGGPGQNPNWKDPKQMNPAPEVSMAVLNRRAQNTKVSQTTDSKGRTTTSVRGDSSISPENLSRYGYTRY